VTGPRIGLVTYSVKPRGGVAHTLWLAEALHRLGADVTVLALGDSAGFFRPVAVPVKIVGPPAEGASLEERVFASVASLAAGLSVVADDFDLFHAQDCISARAAARVRDGGAGVPVVRTVHHVDDFTTQALIDCQHQAILEPDRALVVSEHWRTLLRDGYGVDAEVVYNGADGRPFPPVPAGRRAALRHRIGAGDGRFVFLTVGGIEPRKGSAHLLAALAALDALDPRPVLAIVGGHSFQDYRAYREAALASLGPLGLELGRDVVLLGTVDDDELGDWYGVADAFVFPSLNEGWGLVVLEALSAGLPVVATDIAVFREYLTDGKDALLVPPADPSALARAMRAVATDAPLRHRLVRAGHRVASRFTWEATARRHLEIYGSVTSHPAGHRRR
jgi:glycosyltransferase-like protein